MTQNSIINSLPYSEQLDPLTTYGDRKKSEWAALDARIPGRFSSFAVRNSTYAAFTAQGGVLTDGMTCSVAGRWFIYRDGQWRATEAAEPVYGPATRQLPLARNDGVEDSFYAGTIADPGYPYKVFASAAADTYANNCVLEIRVRIGLGATDSEVPVVTNARNYYNNVGQQLITPRWCTGTLIGPCRIIGYAQRVGGSGDWNITAAGVRYEIVPG